MLALTSKGKELGVNFYWDAVLNHKAAADKKEKCHVVEVDTNSMPDALNTRRLCIG